MSSAEPTPVLGDVSKGIMTITLNRPDRGNAWNAAMSRDYLGMLGDAARNAEVRAIIVTGAGKAFCTGGDGELLGGIAGSDGVDETNRVVPGQITDHLLAIRVGKPVIAAVNGACFGIGMQQAMCCDIRIGSEDAKFSTAFARRGLPAEMGISWLLSRLVGTGHASDLLLSARLVRAPEAERIGLVNRVVPAANLMQEARTYAREIVEKCAPSAMAKMKAQLWRDMTRDVQASYDEAHKLMDAGFSSADFREGIASWQEGRNPEFPPLSGDEGFIE